MGPSSLLLIVLLSLPQSGPSRDRPTPPPAGGSPVPVVVERARYLMGTLLSVRVEAPRREDGVDAAEAAFAEVARLEELLSTWTAGSAVARLNQAPAGHPLSLDPELLGLLLEAESWAEATGRRFDPTVGALVDAWNLRGPGRIPGPALLNRARTATGPGTFTFVAATGTATRHHPLGWIDTGSFGKGAALRAAGRVLAARGVERAVLDFGGQLLVLGGGAGPGGTLPVEVAHPLHRDRGVCRLRIATASVATTSAGERYVVVEGGRFGHVLDPRSGHPVPAWGSATVVAHDPLVADVLSTALFVMGPEEGLRWAQARTDVGVFLLTLEGDEVLPRWNRAMEPWLATDRPPCDPLPKNRGP